MTDPMLVAEIQTILRGAFINGVKQAENVIAEFTSEDYATQQIKDTLKQHLISRLNGLEKEQADFHSAVIIAHNQAISEAIKLVEDILK